MNQAEVTVSAAKKLRKEFFYKKFPYDSELAETAKKWDAPPEGKRKQSHEFLLKPLWQNSHIYLVEYVIAFCRRWFGGGEFNMLDWGSGKCQVSYLLKKRNIDVTSCDVEEKRADSSFGQYTPLAEAAGISVVPLTHAYKLPFENESFSVVLSFGVLEHVPNDVESLNEIYRILKPGGLFFCFFLPYRFGWKQIRDHVRERRRHPDNPHYYHDRLYNKKIVKEKLAASNLELLDFWYRDLFPKSRTPPFYHVYENLDNWFCRNTPLKHLAANIEFAARRPLS